MLYIYSENIVFKEIVEELFECFKKAGIKAIITTEIKPDNFLDLYIICGMNDFSSQIVPNNYIVYQLEQTTGNDESKWFSKTYLNYLKNALAVWDYSLINYQNLRKLNIGNIQYVPMQYMPSVDKIIHKEPSEKDIDVFFYGSINERRQKIIDQLKERGLHVVSKSNVWKNEREDLLARSKLVINIHYFEHSILETVRLSYLLSNQCSIISEVSLDPVLDKWHSSYLKLVPYDQLVDACCQFINEYPQSQISLGQYKKETYMSKIPFNKFIELYSYLITMIDENTQENNDNQQKSSVQPQAIDSSDIFEAEYEINKNKELILKLPKFSYKELPHVSIVTITYNRKAIFPMAVRNWELFEYPRDKLEWIIVDDSEDGTTLTDILPKSQQIKYFKLQTTGRLSIGQKRNFGVEQASHEYIAFMDDDDYYYPLSIYARMAILLKYPQYDLVGVTNLDIYDVVDDFCAKINSPHVSEASMAFRKSFWKEQNFPNKFNTLGEGYPFTKNRRHRIIKMPSCFNIIALTHWENYTQTNRSFQKFRHVEKKDNLLRILDLQTRLFIFTLFDKVKKNLKK